MTSKTELSSRPLLCTVILCAAISLVAVPCCVGGLIMGEHDFEIGTHGWDSDSGFANVQQKSPGGSPGGWLEIELPATSQGPGGSEWYDVIQTDADNLFAGGWDTDQWVEFDFWHDEGVIPALQVRWQSASNDYVWAYEVVPEEEAGWNNYGANFADWTQWDTLTPFGASEEQYLADLSTIDWIGIYIRRDGAAQQVYGMDDFQLMVPEPAEIIMLAAALTTSGMTLRRSKRKRVSAAAPGDGGPGPWEMV